MILMNKLKKTLTNPIAMLRIFLLYFLFISCTLNGQQGNDIDQKAHALVEAFVKNQNVPGLSATVYHKGEIVWSEGFGYANLEHEVPVIPEKTKFRIGSVSKTLTASALGRLMDTRTVDLDAPIQQYVPSFPEKVHPITLRQLGGHTAGIRHYKGGEFMSSKHYATVLEGLDIFKESPLLFEPTTKYQYSSYGWNLLSAGIETLATTSFLEYMDAEVFRKLDMTNTVAEYHETIIPHRTSYYYSSDQGVQNAPYVDNSYKWAGGGFLSTTHDLIKFGKAHMKSGYLSESTLNTLTSPQQLSDGSSTNYGIGWRTYTDKNGLKWIGHSGGSVGGTTIFVMNLENDMIIAMTGNKSSIRYGDIHFQLGQLFLN